MGMVNVYGSTYQEHNMYLLVYNYFFFYIKMLFLKFSDSSLVIYFFFVKGFIILSCIIAVSVNFSTFLVIGKTSPVTYQVLGHLKTCLVLGFGYTLLHDPFTERNIIGIFIAVCGMGLYSYLCTQETKRKQSGDLLLGSQVFISFLLSLSQIVKVRRLLYEKITYQ